MVKDGSDILIHNQKNVNPTGITLFGLTTEPLDNAVVSQKHKKHES